MYVEDYVIQIKLAHWKIPDETSKATNTICYTFDSFKECFSYVETLSTRKEEFPISFSIDVNFRGKSSIRHYSVSSLEGMIYKINLLKSIIYRNF